MKLQGTQMRRKSDGPCQVLMGVGRKEGSEKAGVVLASAAIDLPPLPDSGNSRLRTPVGRALNDSVTHNWDNEKVVGHQRV